MSSIRRILSSRANGALSRGPSSAEAKARSSHNAMRHGLLARQVLLENESKENFQLLFQQHVDRFQRANGVEIGLIEEMCSAYWRLRRCWAIETRMLDDAAADKPGDLRDRLVAAFTHPDSLQSLATMHRYESRLHLMYQRAIKTMLLLKAASAEPETFDLPNDPNPVSEQLEQPDPVVPAAENPQLPNDPSPISDHQEVGQAPWPPRLLPDPHPVLPNEPNPISGQSGPILDDLGLSTPPLAPTSPQITGLRREPGAFRQPPGEDERVA